VRNRRCECTKVLNPRVRVRSRYGVTMHT
jgi:hypothetical protein